MSFESDEDFVSYNLTSLNSGTSLNDMKDMLASLPQLREAKEKVSFGPPLL